MAADVMADGYQRALADAAGKGAAQAELSILAVMVARLRAVAEGQGMAAAYAAMASDMAEIRRLLGEGAETVRAGAELALSSMASENDAWAAPSYEAAGVGQVPAAEDAALAAVVSRGAREIAEGAADSFRTSVLALVDAEGRAQPMADRYRRLVAEVATRSAMGGATRDQALREAVMELAKSGCRVRYASGRTRDLYAAVRANVSAVARETAQGLREQQGREFGADGVLISSHPNCAEDHRKYQGRAYTHAEFERLQARLPRKIGEHNCRHTTTPILLATYRGKSEEARRYNRESAETVEVTGLDGRKRSMSRYRATQYQRQIESRMRGLDRERKLARAAGLEDEARRINRRRAELRAAYRRAAKEAGLAERMERTRWPGEI